MTLFPLIPANAGIQFGKNGDLNGRKLFGKDWVPASAGTSGSKLSIVIARRAAPKQSGFLLRPWIASLRSQ